MTVHLLNMEVMLCFIYLFVILLQVATVNSHAMNLLRRMNCQRIEGQFCDCVIRPAIQLGPSGLYLAHKNILAASSPIMASLLPTTGALLDLQVPCLTKEVLESLLDYIYTGALPPSHKNLSLLSAATYLQMEELQLSLRRRLDAAHRSAKCAEPEWIVDGKGQAIT